MIHLKSVLLIYTGGTIGMYKSGDGGLKAFDLEKLKSQKKTYREKGDHNALPY